jgi:hypothetical protein
MARLTGLCSCRPGLRKKRRSLPVAGHPESDKVAFWHFREVITRGCPLAGGNPDVERDIAEGPRPTTWNEFLPMSMPITAIVGLSW